MSILLGSGLFAERVMKRRPAIGTRSRIDWKQAKHLYVREELSYARIARQLGFDPRLIARGLQVRGVPERPGLAALLPTSQQLSLGIERCWNQARDGGERVGYLPLHYNFRGDQTGGGLASLLLESPRVPSHKHKGISREQ